MKSRLIALTMIIVTLACAQKKEERIVGISCEDCNLMNEGMPANLSWKTNLTDANEPGEAMIITGTIFKRDGKTPAPNVILYVYHTDAKGLYSPGTNQQHAIRHGHLRGWMKTDKQGRYQLTTIRPGSYPSRKAPQHIHPIIKEPDTNFYWIDEYLFEDDPLLTIQERNQQEKRGGSGIVKLSKNDQGVWVGKRNIILGMNIPNY